MRRFHNIQRAYETFFDPDSRKMYGYKLQCGIAVWYYSVALQYHPDVCPLSAKEESMRRFHDIQRPYETLSDPDSRKMHDYELQCGISSRCKGR
ncbi:hypothetical protein GIB67_026053 [Kingdonia uniflora]|uniref:J domain-containing protein n=1 Tax=Kingdonia uniflora TaxID=39325 RepID=A0A7J7M2X0_9MAGN|nr:hypothetical protein GIB67_026053 [Kingdonia uniflora]